ncbi:MAG: LLM class F420-dependent oxidoreductase [Sphingomonadales bacterium]|nr:LLM class F420-dependent oxidoreductase [Sphingomonadales bacterium]
MKIGVKYPTREIPGDPDALRKFCAAAEEAGFSHLLLPDHVVKCPHEGREPKLTGPYTEKDAFDDPFVWFAYAAAVTKLEFVTGVLVLPQRQTVLVAQQAADVDLLSRQRLRLGVGIGWNYVEYDALGQDFKTRARRFEEQVEFLRMLWKDPIVSFEGRFDRIDRAGINPRPKRQIPVWIGGHSEVAYERGARIGDGFIFAGDGAVGVAGLERVQHHLKAFGRDVAGYGSELLALFARSPAESAEHLQMFRDAGGTHGSLRTTDKGFGANLDAHIEYMLEAKRIYDAG